MKPHTYLSVSLDDQKLSLIRDGACVREFVVSTALKGMGTAIGSFRTPTGNFRICQKIGAGEPIGRIFRAREPKGLWDPSQATDDDMILTRILRLDGLDDSNANTLERCIYIHGTNREDLLGVPSSHGCIRMRNDHIVELFEQLVVGDVVRIQPATKLRGKLLFLNGDALVSLKDHQISRLSDWIAAAKASGWMPVLLSNECGRQVVDLADYAGVDHVERTNQTGTTKVIREWKSAMLPQKVMMISDGFLDLETKPFVDLYVGCGDVAERPMMMKECDRWLDSFDASSFNELLGHGNRIL